MHTYASIYISIYIYINVKKFAISHREIDDGRVLLGEHLRVLGEALDVDDEEFRQLKRQQEQSGKKGVAHSLYYILYIWQLKRQNDQGGKVARSGTFSSIYIHMHTHTLTHTHI